MGSHAILANMISSMIQTLSVFMRGTCIVFKITILYNSGNFFLQPTIAESPVILPRLSRHVPKHQRSFVISMNLQGE